MDNGVLPEVQHTGDPGKNFPPAQNAGHTQRSHAAHAGATRSDARMRFLHFENTFGATHASEYCMDAMLSLVLFMVRNARPDAARLARLTGAAGAAYPGTGDCPPGAAAV